MRLCIQTNPLFTDEVIESYKNNTRVAAGRYLPTVLARMSRVDRGFYEASINLVYNFVIDRIGDISDDNPHSTWLSYASVFNNKASAFDWVGFTTRDWGQKFGNVHINIPSRPRSYVRSDARTRNASPIASTGSLSSYGLTAASISNAALQMMGSNNTSNNGSIAQIDYAQVEHFYLNRAYNNSIIPSVGLGIGSLTGSGVNLTSQSGTIEVTTSGFTHAPSWDLAINESGSSNDEQR